MLNKSWTTDIKSEEYISLLSEQLNILMVCAYLKIAEYMETPKNLILSLS